MKATFDFNGYTLHIGGRYVITPPDSAQSHPDHMVPFALTRDKLPSLNPLTGDEKPDILCGFYIEPSHARAIASALLSAAVEARG